MSEKERIQKLGQRLLDPSSQFYIDGILDVVFSLVTDCDHPAIRKNKHIEGFINRFDPVSRSIQSERLNYSDFSLVKVIGQGAFGQVQLVRHRSSNRVFAMKILNKSRMLDQSNSAFFWEEREIMARTTSEWLVKLFYAFMDKVSLYICMEYMPGGDLVTWLTNNEDITEDQAAFYTAEIVLGLEALHSMGFIHRDVKPENMLLDRGGHVKMADFGTCVRLGADGFVQTSSAIGTPDYISPEVLFCQEKSGKIGPQCDWWAVGVVLFEMLFGETAFYGDSLVVTYGRIMNHKTSLVLPDDIPVSSEAKDIIQRFLTDPEVRLGSKGSGEVKEHAFFQRESWSWDNIRRCVPPFVPELSSDVDTSNFDDIEDESKKTSLRDQPKIFNGENMAFAGFTFNRDCAIISAGGGSDLGSSGSFSTDLQQEYDDLQALNAELKSQAFALEKRQALRELEIKDLERKVETVEVEKKRYVEQVKQAKHVLAEERLKKDQVKLECDRYLDDVTKAKKVGKNLEDQLEDERRALTSLKSRLNDRDEVILSLEKDVENYTNRLRESTQSRCELETELLELVEKMEEERDANKAMRDRQLGFEKRNRELENSCEQALARQEQSQRELSMLQETRKILDSKVDQLTAELDHLRSGTTVAGVEGKAADTSSQRVEDLESQLVQLREEIKALNLVQHEAEIKLSGVTSELQIKDKDNQYLKGLLNDEKHRFTDQEEQLAALTTFCQAQKQDIAKLKTSFNEMDLQRSQLAAQLNDLKAAMKKKDEETVEIKEKLETASLFSDAYKIQVADLEDTASSLTYANKELKSKYELSKSELETAASNLRHLTVQLDDERDSAHSVKEQLSQKERDATVLEMDLKTAQQTHASDVEVRDVTISKLRDSEALFTAKVDDLTSEVRTAKEQLDVQGQDMQGLAAQNLKLQREVDVEKKKVLATVGKLDELISSGSFKQQKKMMQKTKSPGSVEDYRVLEKRYRNLESEADKRQKQLTEKIASLKKELLDRTESFAEENKLRNSLQKDLEDQKRLNAELYERLDLQSEDEVPTSLGDMRTKEGEVDINSKGRGKHKILWNPNYSVLKPFCLQFFTSRVDRESGSHPTMEIMLSQIVLVREVSQADVLHAKPEDLPRIFQILYYPDVTPSHAAKDDSSEAGGGIISWQGHSFQHMRFRYSTMCHACNRVCSDMLNPPSALECTNCHIKVHYDHVDKHQRIAACTDASKIQLVRVASASEKHAWTARINELREVQKNADSSASASMLRVSPNLSIRSSFAQN